MIHRVILYKSIWFTTVLAGLLAVSCNGNGRQSGPKKGPSQGFTLPTIPSIITNPAERNDYLTMHFWDNLDFSDTSLIHKPNILEQAFVDYIVGFPYISPGLLRNSVHKTMERALENKRMFSYFTELFERYLFGPTSPYLNEEYYSLVLEYIIAAPQIDNLMKEVPRFQLNQVNKNRMGTVAADFVYTQAIGKQESMHKIKSEFLILFFNNPGCQACAEYQHGLEYSPVVTKLVDSGRLKIIAIYVDEDLTSWKNYLSSLPSSWLNGYDAGTVIRNLNLYDLRAIPSLYLLDGEKRVMLKDALPNQVEERLLYHVQNP